MEFTFDWIDVLLLSPAICLILGSLLPLTVKILNGNKEPNSYATLFYGLAGVIAASGFILGSTAFRRTAFQGALAFDGISAVLGLIILAIAAACLIYSRDNLATNNRQFSEYVFLLLNAAAGMLLVLWSQDLIVFFVGVELMSLSLYVMIAISAEDRQSKEASFKYFVLGGFASALLLYGIALVYGTAGVTNLAKITEITMQMIETSRLFLIGMVLVILGVAFKVSIFPFHAWTPDVYQGAPTPVTAFMAAGVKVATFAMFLRLFATEVLIGEQSQALVDVLQWLAALTMLAGNIAAILQKNLKRMLAYSSVAHSGYIMMGLLVAGAAGNTTGGSSSVLFYLIAYAMMTLGAFGILSALEKSEQSSLTVDDLKGLGSRNPWMSACLAILLFSMAGIPPTVGFFAKFFVFAAAINQGYFWLTIWAVVSSIVGVYYYLRPIVAMYMQKGEGVEFFSDRFLSIGIASATAMLVVVLGLLSSPLMSYVSMALR